VGIDIGGANLKYASVHTGASAAPTSHSRAFELWRHPEQLASALIDDLRHFPLPDALAVTMTGELADCFLDRAVGVHHIVEHALQAAKAIGIRCVAFYCVDGTFCDAPRAIAQPDRVAAANWHALASWVAGHIVESGLLVDIGSTTTDIIPIARGIVATDAKSDFERLREGSLVYVGCRRTPVCALVAKLTFRGQTIETMNERFATIDDARIVLGAQPPCPADCDSADGTPRTVSMSANRLARMIGLDHRSVSVDDAAGLAQQIVDAARLRIHRAVEKFSDTHSPILISGHGPDLLPVTPEQQPLCLTERLGAGLSRSAPAFAVANHWLARAHSLSPQPLLPKC